MANFQSIPWGNTQIRFHASTLAQKDVREAARLVSPSFENMQDSFVALSMDGPQVVAAVPVKPKAKVFPVSIDRISIPEAMKQALEKAATFLKGRV